MMTWAFLVAAVFTRPMERVSTIDPAQSQSLYDAHVLSLVYQSVLEVDYQARPYRLAPGYCQMPEVSADGLVYRFRTASGDAQGVVDALERLRDPKVLSPNGWIVKDVNTIRRCDSGTVEVVLKRRVHYFPWLMTMPATAVRTRQGEGTGAYRLDKWRKNHEMVFVRRRPEKGAFDEIRYLVVDDMSTQWLMFLKGEIDFLGEVSRDNWDSIVGPDGRLDPILSAQGVRMLAVPALDVLYVGFNMRDPVVGSNRALRQALNAAFDYPAWERFYNGRVLPCDGPLPPGIGGRLETPFPYRFDLARARALLTQAGYANGIDAKTGRRLTLTLTIGRASQESREAGELLAAFYERIGIRLELQFMTWNAFLKAVNEGRVQMYRMGWVGDYPDAQNFLQLFHSPNVSPGPNHSFYVSADFDRVYEAALAAETEEERRDLWKRCQEIIREDCPWVFTHFNKSFSLVRKRVGNYVPSAFPCGSERHYRVVEETEK